MKPNDSPFDTRVSEIAAMLRNGPAAVLTGAGVSTDSGIPDYRSPGAPPRNPMQISQFMHDPAYRRRFWAGARVGAERTAAVVPNAGHFALARLEDAGYVNGVITQNVDGLHARAGSRGVAELHGNGDIIRCVDCGHRWSRRTVLGWFDSLNPGFAEARADAEIAPDGDAIVTGIDGVAVPTCPECGGILRPAVVYFGETSNPAVFDAAASLVAGASALLVTGTSLAVNTGIRLVHRAERRGLPIAVINRGPTAIDARPSVRVRIDGGISESLEALTRLLG